MELNAAQRPDYQDSGDRDTGTVCIQPKSTLDSFLVQKVSSNTAWSGSS